jgi:hypothetical protein
MRRLRSLLGLSAAVAALPFSGACQTAGLQRAYTALDSAGDRKRSEFFTDTAAIWCDADYSSGRRGLTIAAQIRSVRLWDPVIGDFVAVDADLADGELVGQPGTGTTVGFQWTVLLPDGGASEGTATPYPVGDFVCNVTLDGDLAASVPFTVRFPECPVPPVAAGVTCEGWVREGSTCPDVLGRPCTCAGGLWRC